jgi:excisionase family DNA binding protein
MSATAVLQSVLPDPRELLTNEQAAAVLGVSPHTLNVWRSCGRYSLPFLRIGKLIRYRRADLDAWMDSRRHGAEVVA